MRKTEIIEDKKFFWHTFVAQSKSGDTLKAQVLRHTASLCAAGGALRVACTRAKEGLGQPKKGGRASNTQTHKKGNFPRDFAEKITSSAMRPKTSRVFTEEVAEKRPRTAITGGELTATKVMSKTAVLSV